MDALRPLLGDSPAMRALADRLQRILDAPGKRLPPILIEGETGTGKSYLAAALHRASPRASQPFVSVNCAAIPRELLEAELFGYERGAFTGARGAKPGLFQTATRGTLFLDEIGFLGESLQAKLLTVLEERTVRRLGATRSEPVDLWIMAATNSELRRVVREGGFLEALFHRLAVVTVSLPPLRDRGADVLLLAERLLARACAQYEIPPKTLADDARAALVAYSFPGNIRELSNVMERVALLQRGQVVSREMLELPAPLAHDGAARDDASTSDDPELLAAALAANDWNVSRAAAYLRIPRSTLRSRIERHGLRRTQTRPETRAAFATSGPERLAVLDVVPGEPNDPVHVALSATEVALKKARTFGAHAITVRARSGRATFRLDGFEDGVRVALAAAHAVERALAAHGSAYRLLLHIDRFESEADVDRRMLPSQRAFDLPTGLLVSKAAAGILRRRIATEPVGAGWHRMLGAPRFDLEPNSGLAPLVGRSVEIALVERRLAAAREGRGQLLGIQGEPGIGKSRLVAELLPVARRLGFTHVEGASLAYGKSMPYLPVVEVVRALAGASEGDGALQVAAKIDAQLERLELSAEVGQHLLRLLGIGDLETGPSPETVQAQARAAVTSFVLASARETPLLLVFEDVQWLDAASRELLASLAQEVAAAPVALVATYRPGAAPSWMDRPQATQLSLLPLSAVEAAELAAAVVGHEGASTMAAVGAIVERAEGNPFFIEELALTLRARQEVPARGLPDSILDAVSSRIAALGTGARSVLVTASVAGRSCPLPLLRALLPKRADVETCVDELARLELVYLKTRGVERSLVFRHVVTQEVAYGLLSSDERRALHGSAARALEALHADRHDEVIELLAHHHVRGDDPERAIDVLSRALVKAVAANALDAAQSCFDEATRIFETLPSTPENRRRRMQLLVAEHAVPLFFLSLRVEEYLRMLDALERDAVDLGDPAVLGMLHARKGHCLWWIGRFDAAVESARRALDLLEPLGLPVLAVHTVMMNSLYAKGDLRGVIRHERRTLEVIERERHVRWSAYVLGVIAWAHARLGHRDEALALGQRTLQLARDRNDTSVSSFAHWSLAMVLATVGDLAAALDHAEHAVVEAPTPADRMWAESVRAGLFCRRPEDAAHGTATLGALVPILRRSHQLAAEDLFIPPLGEGYVRLGRLDDGRRVFEELLACAERHGMRYLEASACGWLAKIAQQRDVSSARPLRERSERILAELAVPSAARLTLSPPAPST